MSKSITGGPKLYHGFPRSRTNLQFLEDLQRILHSPAINHTFPESMEGTNKWECNSQQRIRMLRYISERSHVLNYTYDVICIHNMCSKTRRTYRQTAFRNGCFGKLILKTLAPLPPISELGDTMCSHTLSHMHVTPPTLKWGFEGYPLEAKFRNGNKSHNQIPTYFSLPWTGLPGPFSKQRRYRRQMHCSEHRPAWTRLRIKGFCF